MLCFIVVRFGGYKCVVIVEGVEWLDIIVVVFIEVVYSGEDMWF